MIVYVNEIPPAAYDPGAPLWLRGLLLVGCIAVLGAGSAAAVRVYERWERTR